MAPEPDVGAPLTSRPGCIIFEHVQKPRCTMRLPVDDRGFRPAPLEAPFALVGFAGAWLFAAAIGATWREVERKPHLLLFLVTTTLLTLFVARRVRRSRSRGRRLGAVAGWAAL